MIRLLALLPLLLWSTGALALSCLPHDVAAIYKDAQASEDRYLIVIGTITFDESLLPVTDMARQMDTPPDSYIPARLTGLALSRAGFNHPYDAQITLNAQCLGPWCAGAASGGRYLAFVNLDRDLPEVTITPCGGFTFPDPTRAMEQQVIACRNGGVCVPGRLR